MDYDLPTAISGTALTTTGLTLMLALFFAFHRRAPGAVWWLVANAMLALSMNLYRLRANSWFDERTESTGFVLLTIGLPGLLLGLAGLMITRGFREVLGLAGFSRLIAGATVVYLGTFAWLTLGQPSLGLRTIVLALFLAGAAVYTAVLLLRHAGTGLRLIGRILAGIWIVIALSYTKRIYDVSGEVLAGVTESAVLAGKEGFLFASVVTALWTMSAVLLSLQRERILAQDRIDEQMQAERQEALRDQRAQISRDLHDTLSGTTATIHLLAQAGLEDGNAEAALASIERLAGEANGEVRSILNKLSHPDTSRALWAAELRLNATHLAEAAGLHLHWECAGMDEEPIGDPLASVNLLRALKEAFQNAVRHAGAENLWFSCTADQGSLKIVLADDGCGLPADPPSGRGLPNLATRTEELGGTLALTNTPGLQLTFHLPLPLRFIPETERSGEVGRQAAEGGRRAAGRGRRVTKVARRA